MEAPFTYKILTILRKQKTAVRKTVLHLSQAFRGMDSVPSEETHLLQYRRLTYRNRKLVRPHPPVHILQNLKMQSLISLLANSKVSSTTLSLHGQHPMYAAICCRFSC